MPARIQANTTKAAKNNENKHARINNTGVIMAISFLINVADRAFNLGALIMPNFVVAFNIRVIFLKS